MPTTRDGNLQIHRKTVPSTCHNDGVFLAFNEVAQGDHEIVTPPPPPTEHDRTTAETTSQEALLFTND